MKTALLEYDSGGVGCPASYLSDGQLLPDRKLSPIS